MDWSTFGPVNSTASDALTAAPRTMPTGHRQRGPGSFPSGKTIASSGKARTIAIGSIAAAIGPMNATNGASRFPVRFAQSIVEKPRNTTFTAIGVARKIQPTS